MPAACRSRGTRPAAFARAMWFPMFQTMLLPSAACSRTPRWSAWLVMAAATASRPPFAAMGSLFASVCYTAVVKAGMRREARVQRCAKKREGGRGMKIRRRTRHQKSHFHATNVGGRETPHTQKELRNETLRASIPSPPPKRKREGVCGATTHVRAR